jgi:hypothetical protein
VQVRAIPNPATKLRSGGNELAQARGMLALNSVGLALEGFRKLQIEQPTNPEVLAGIAECYAAMGRDDLERSYYERALGYAPHDQAILAAYANSLERHGDATRAAQVRTELALETAPPMQQPQTGSLTVKLPPARPVPTNAKQLALSPPAVQSNPQVSTSADAVQIGPARMEPAVVDLAAARPVTLMRFRAVALEVPAIASVAAPMSGGSEAPHDNRSQPQVATVQTPAQIKRARAAEPAPLIAPIEKSAGLRRSPVSVPPAIAERQITSKAAPSAAALVTKLATMDSAIKPREPRHPIEQLSARSGPRLERLSIGEVAILTKQGPIWSRQMASSSPPSVPVQWLPLRTVEARPAIQILNAARSQGLAARTRIALADRGWRRLRIGDYGAVRLRSLVLYSPEHAPTGRRLAAQFGCKAVEVSRKNVLVVLLGRDEARRKSSPLRA